MTRSQLARSAVREIPAILLLEKVVVREAAARGQQLELRADQVARARLLDRQRGLADEQRRGVPCAGSRRDSAPILWPRAKSCGCEVEFRLHSL